MVVPARGVRAGAGCHEEYSDKCSDTTVVHGVLHCTGKLHDGVPCMENGAGVVPPSALNRGTD